MKRSLNVAAVCDGRVTRALSIPEECNNRSRWLSGQAIPPDIDPRLSLPRSGVAQNVIPFQGIGFNDLFRWYRALRGLNHRLGLSQASGLPEPSKSTLAEVSAGVAG